MSYEFCHADLAQALFDALIDDPFYKTLRSSVADTQRSTDAMLAYLDYSMTEAQQWGELLIPDDHRYGVSVWSRPLDAASQQERSAQKQAFITGELGVPSLKVYKEITSFMSEPSARETDESDWYLSILGVLPEHQGQGLGPGLIRPVLDKTDRLGVATFLETFTPRNMSFYKRLGYDEQASFVEPFTRSRYWLMRRLPPEAKPK